MGVNKRSENGRGVRVALCVPNICTHIRIKCHKFVHNFSICYSLQNLVACLKISYSMDTNYTTRRFVF
jgi:hypothetical protein